MHEIEQSQLEAERFPTGVPGLDTILCGGLMRGSVSIIRGAPGTGKTILANQICFHHARQGGCALYVTLLTESHDCLMRHLSKMSFYDSAQIPKSIYYISGFDTLLKQGLSGIFHLLYAEYRAHKASFVVLDGILMVEETIHAEQEFRKFISDLAILASLMNCPLVLITNTKRGSDSPEYTMADSWLDLDWEEIEYRSFRSLRVYKHRGSDFIAGRHTLTISEEGVQVFPRLETIVGRNPFPSLPEGRIESGVPELDVILGGGIPRASTTLILGPSGVGKTTFGLHFIGQCSQEQPGLIFGFYETAERLFSKAEAMGVDLKGLVHSGAVEIIWHPPVEQLLDQLGYRLLEAVSRRGVKRLLVDGLGAFEQSILYPGRLGRFLSALVNTLREHTVTTVYTEEIPELIGGENRLSFGQISAAAENIILLRYVELGSELHRAFSMVKVRESYFDPAIREFSITGQGIRLGKAFKHSESLLTGHARRQITSDQG
jgi:circadian clock protein KaiC